MNKIVLMAGLSSAAVNLGTYPIDETKVSDRATTVKYEANTNFKICECDLTANACDGFCCCDTECPEATRAQWTKSSQCKNVEYLKDIDNVYPLNDCMNSTA
jgi:hypothetical protein